MSLMALRLSGLRVSIAGKPPSASSSRPLALYHPNPTSQPPGSAKHLLQRGSELPPCFTFDVGARYVNRSAISSQSSGWCFLPTDCYIVGYVALKPAILALCVIDINDAFKFGAFCV